VVEIDEFAVFPMSHMLRQHPVFADINKDGLELHS